MPGSEPCPELRRQRVAAATYLAGYGGGFSDVAYALNMSVWAVRCYFVRNAPALAVTLAEQGRENAGHPLPAYKVLERLKIVRDAPSNAVAARIIGISAPRISEFIKRYAPWGIDDAIADYE